MKKTHANPLLAASGLPRFGEIQPEHVVPGMRKLLAELTASLQELEQRPGQTWETLMAPLEELTFRLNHAWGPVNHLMGVQNSDALREAYETVQSDVVDFFLRLGQSRPLFEAMESLQAKADLDVAQRRILELELRDMRHSGIELEGAQRERFNEIARELSQLSTTFSNNVLDATKAHALELKDPHDVEGLPASLLGLAAASYAATKENATGDAPAERGPWRFTLDLPSFLPFMQHCRRRDLRRDMYLAYVSRAASGRYDNIPNIRRILVLRRERAKLLGYETHAELSVAEKMAGTVAAVDEMHERLLTACRSAAEADLEELQERAQADGVSDLAHWDVAFYSERLREERFEYTDEELRPYFPLPKVLAGMFALVERIFGIRVQAADGQAPVWHADVRYFQVLDESGERIAAFYLDPYSRPADKRGGAWMDECLSRRRVDGGLTLPVAYLVCNGTPPVGDQPSLLTFSETETLFHEFGHGLQHMLTEVDHAYAAGIHGVEWDAVELPSQFMENWCYHKPTLDSLTGHVTTGEPLPESLYQKLVGARNFRAGSNMLRQLRLGMLDMELHHRYDPNSDASPFDVQARIDERTALLPPLPEDRFLCSFGHIFAGGYSAGYYSYKWAEIMSADAFGAFEEAGLDQPAALRDVGRRFRETVLALGGSQHPSSVYQAFRGRDPEPESLLRQYGLLRSA